MVSAVFLALPFATMAARVVKHENPDWPPKSAFNHSHSESHAVNLWDKIDEMAGRDPDGQPLQTIQFFDDSEAEGIPRVGHPFQELFLDKMETDLEFRGMAHDPSRAAKHVKAFRTAFEKEEGEVLVVTTGRAAGQVVENQLNFNLGASLFLKPDALQDVRLTVMAKTGGRKKMGVWFGRLLRPLDSTLAVPESIFDQGAAKSILCPNGAQVRPRKMAIPLEYNSMVAKQNVVPAFHERIPFEEFKQEYEANPRKYARKPLFSAAKIVQTSRLLGYRRAILYVKYTCKDHKHQGVVTWINEVSLILGHEKEAKYDVFDFDGVTKKGEFPTPSTFQRAM